jgi:hypothetical protein
VTTNDSYDFFFSKKVIQATNKTSSGFFIKSLRVKGLSTILRDQQQDDIDDKAKTAHRQKVTGAQEKYGDYIFSKFSEWESLSLCSELNSSFKQLCK